MRADAVDEVSLVVAPVIGDGDGKPLFMDSHICSFELIESRNENGCLILKYKRSKT